MADWKLKQGDQAAIKFSDTLTYSDGSAVDLTGASVKFVMRARSSNAPTTNLAATIVSAPAGTVSYTPTAADTATAGLYVAYWAVTFSGGGTMRFPTDGYNTVEIQENLETTNQTIVELDDVKDYLNLQAADRSHDGELLRFIAGITPVVEGITGPILPRIYSEKYDGGYWYIRLRHRPIIEVHSVVEYRGPIPYPLQQVPTPDLGTIYSYMFDETGRIIRRTVGGGMTPFPAGADQVFVTYTAGFLAIPQNVRLGTLELVRVNYQPTQQAGRPAFGGAGGPSPEDQIGQFMGGFFVPQRVRELLSPNRRAPSVA